MSGSLAQATEIEVVYCSGQWFGRGSIPPVRGGYCARLKGFSEQGEGQSPEESLRDLEARLREWVHTWDADADDYAPTRRSWDAINEHSEPPLLRWTRAQLRAGSLMPTLGRITKQPIPDSSDVPLG